MPIPESAAEKAFYETARSILLDKAPQLMKYELGFQTIDKNDTMTKIVGAAAFKIDTIWLFIPLFYLNGEVKGYDLLYVKNSDIFVPLKDNWIEFIINKRPVLLGKAVDKSEAEKITAPNLWNIKLPITTKYASDMPKFIELIKESEDAALTLYETLKDKEKGNILNKALEKFNINKLLDAFKPYINSAIQKDIIKTSAIVEKAPIPEPIDTAQNLSDKEKEFLLKYTVYIRDTKGPKSELQLTETKEYTTPLKQGAYVILGMDGKLHNCYCIEYKINSISDFSDYLIIDVDSGDILFLSKEKLHAPAAKELSMDVIKAKSIAPEDMKVGNAYIVISPSHPQQNIYPIIVKRISKQNDVVWVDCLKGDRWDIYNNSRLNSLVFIPNGLEINNFDDYDVKFNIIDKNNVLIFPLNIIPKKNESIYEYNKFHYMPIDALMKSAGVQCKIYTDGINYFHTVGGDTSRCLDKGELIHRLVKREGLSIKDAYQLIDKVDENRTVRYMIKYAQGYPNMAYNVSATAPLDVVMGAIPPGAMMGTTEQVSQLSPEDINMINAAMATGQTDILDTALLASLLRTQESAFIVDKYLDDILMAIDRLGRILYLFYWHYDKFKDRYGEDDLPELEDNLINTFKSLGDLYLFLKTKTAVPTLSALERGLGE